MSTTPPDPYQHPGQYPAGGQYPPPQQQPPPMPPQHAPAPGGDPRPNGSDAFFSSLFDLSFSKFVTLDFAKIIYVLAMVVIGLGYLLGVLSAFNSSIGAGVGALLLGWIPALIYLVFVRVGLEFAVSMIKTAQNTSIMANRR